MHIDVSPPGCQAMDGMGKKVALLCCITAAEARKNDPRSAFRISVDTVTIIRFISAFVEASEICLFERIGNPKKSCVEIIILNWPSCF